MKQMNPDILMPAELPSLSVTQQETKSVPEATHQLSASYTIEKRITDVLLASLGLMAFSPVFLIIALCIKLDDKGSILHYREIIGYRGQKFSALKFRTMIQNADEYLEKHPELMLKYQQNMKLEKDPRITRVGRFLRRTSLDELPQLVNVLVGQMSLVGPRIIHPSELARFGKFAAKRLSVKPGLTGLWQISGRQHTSYEERVALDMQYVDRRSWLFDLIILLKTVKVFIIHTGA